MSSANRTAPRQTHAWLLVCPDPERLREEACRLTAAMLCADGGETPCGVCAHCRKVLAGTHPDVLVLGRPTDDKGQKKREIQVDQIRALSAEAVVLPNEAAAKVYVIEEAEAMNAAAQNALLKLLEEPPAWVRLILCAARAEALLPTIRSRCVERCVAGEAPEAEEYRAEALAYLRLAAAGDRAGLLAFCRGLEELDNAACTQFVRQVRGRVEALLCLRETEPALPRAALPGVLEAMEQAERWLRLNVGVKHVLGVLALLEIQ